MFSDNELLARIKLAIADSLLDNGEAEGVIEELDEYLFRIEKLSGQLNWQAPKLYLRLGTAHHMLGQTEQAATVWRRALDFKMYGYFVNNMELMMIADSLKGCDSTFNYDSLSAALSQQTHSPADSIRGWMALFLGMVLAVTAWFFIGIFFALPAVFSSRQAVQNQGTAQPAELRYQPKVIVLNFIRYALIPCVLIPLIVFLIAGRFEGFQRWLLLIGLVAGLAGVLAAFFDARRHALKTSVSVLTILRYRFAPVWLVAAVMISIALAVIMGFAGLAFMFMPFF